MSDERSEIDACDQVSMDLIEFSVGTLTGRSRSRVLEHLATCASCRGELESLAVVADAMLDFAPTAEPSWGFEQRLVERYRADVPRATPRRLTTMSLLVAAALLLVLGVAVGTYVTSRHTPSPAAQSSPPVTAQLTSHGEVLGHVFISAGHPTWLYMTFDDVGWSGEAWCRITLKSGIVKDLGSFSLKDGYGAWTAQVNVAASQIAQAQVTTATGHVLASAALTS
jgi:hypothetical protein